MIESEWSDRSLSLLTQRLARPVRRDPLPPVVPAEVRGRLAERLVPVALELAEVFDQDARDAGERGTVTGSALKLAYHGCARLAREKAEATS